MTQVYTIKKGQVMKQRKAVRRQYRTTIRLNPLEYGNLQLSASRQGITISEAIRLILQNNPPVA